MNTMTANRIQPIKTLGEMADAFKNKIATVTDIAAVIVPSVFILGTAALESGQTGYSPITDTVSELVWCSGGWMEALLFCLNGLFLLLFAARLHRCCGDMANKAGTAMLALAGLSFLTIAVCPTLAPGAAPSFQSVVHEYSARGMSAIFPLACMLLALSWKNNPAYKNISRITVGFGVVGLVLNAIGLLYVAGDLEWIGALERMIILNGFAWLAVLGLYFCHVTHQEHLPKQQAAPARVPAFSLGKTFGEVAAKMLPAPRGIRIPVYIKESRNEYVAAHTAESDKGHRTRWRT
jgi:hypothetical protein